MRIQPASGLLLALLPTAIHAQGARMEMSEGEPRIVVNATRSARIIPDRATVYILVEGNGESPPDAAQRASQKLQAVSTAIRQAGLAVETASAMPYGVTPAPNLNGYPGASAQSSYVARFAIRVQLTRLDQITPLAAAAMMAGASSSSAPVFEASMADSARRVRFTEALASALGGHLGALIEVATTGALGQGGSGIMSFANRYDYGSPTQSPDVQVSATVTVRYRFVPK